MIKNQSIRKNRKMQATLPKYTQKFIKRAKKIYAGWYTTPQSRQHPSHVNSKLNNKNPIFRN